MEKLKLQLAPVAKHWFWISTGLVLLGSLAIWWIASGKLITEYDAASSKIKTDDGKVKTVSSKLAEHPNPKTHEEMQKLIEQSEDAVLAAWTTVYESQQEILVWPVEELKEDFVREFRDLTPIEAKVAFPTGDAEKETSLRNRYRFYIGNVLPGIAEIAKTKWTANFDQAGAGGMVGSGGFGGPMMTEDPGMSGMGYGMPMAQEEGVLVNWDSASQQQLLADLFPWRTTGNPPTTLEVLYSQENLWILRQLMQIIANVNGNASQRFQTKIHDILGIKIGSSVPKTAGIVSKPAGMGGMGAMGEMSTGMDSAMTGMDSAMTGMDMAGGLAMEVDPGDNRYVDLDGKPLTASQLRSALTSNSPTDAFMAVAKRVPVMMSFKMDQRAVPDLIAKCGSARLMVEVGQVRILPVGSSGLANAGDMGSSAMMQPPMGMQDGMGMDSGMSGMGPTGAVPDQFPFDMNVEIYGIIYIYNPPLAEKLGVEQVTTDTVIDGTSMKDGSKVETEPAPAPATAEPVATPPATPEALPAPAATPAPVNPPTDVPGTVNPAAPAGSVPANPLPGTADPNGAVPGSNAAATVPGATTQPAPTSGAAAPSVAPAAVAPPPDAATPPAAN